MYPSRSVRRYRRAIERRNNKPGRLFTLLYRSVLTFLMLLAIGLGYLIITEQRIPTVLNRLQKTLQAQHLHDWLPFEGWFSFGQTDAEVSASLQYQPVADKFYTNQSNQAVCLADGIVIYADYADTLGHTIVIKQDNGVTATYANLESMQAAKDDRVLKGTVIGTYQDRLYLDFFKDRQTLTYDEAMAQN